MKKTYILLLCMFVLSCSEKKYLAKFTDVKFSSTYRPVTPFRSDGFYMPEKELIDSTIPQSQKRIFLKDGSYGEICDEFKKGQKFDLSYGGGTGRIAYGVGIYRVSNDTLYVNSYDRYFFSYEIVRQKFKINNDETITLFEVEFLSLNPRNHKKNSCNKKYVFIPTDSLPSTGNHYLKTHKWIWENEADWRQHMKEYKRNIKIKKQTKRND